MRDRQRRGLLRMVDRRTGALLPWRPPPFARFSWFNALATSGQYVLFAPR
jgi:hypothetical protein